MTTTTQLNSWISARGGKWHRATVAEPTFARDETSACGRTFTPVNVTWDEFPYSDLIAAGLETRSKILALYICQHCA